jgi:hypothetical protein
MYAKEAGWPDWANLLGDRLHWTIFLIAEITQIFIVLFVGDKKLCIRFIKNGLGYNLGDIFTSSSGHPGGKVLL